MVYIDVDAYWTAGYEGMNSSNSTSRRVFPSFIHRLVSIEALLTWVLQLITMVEVSGASEEEEHKIAKLLTVSR